ncbi:MAG: pirin-like C-terminal cupin domain-containing protein, partial [Polyangiaceae bacterium]
ANLRGDLEVTITNGAEPEELLQLQGKPIGEPIAKNGPFVMNTMEEIRQAYADYRRTQFGGWPWDRRDPVHPREESRFARHASGTIERPT